MKICHITVAHPRSDARIFLREASTLAEAGHEVVLVCADGKPDETKNDVLITSYTPCQMTKKERFVLLFKSRKFINYLLSFEADVYQFHDLELIEVGKRLKKRGVKVIFDSHENWIGIIPTYFSNNKAIQKIIAKFFIPIYYKSVVSKFDAVFTVSPNMVEDIQVYNKKTYFVPNYPSIINYNKETFRNKDNFIVYQGMVYSISNQKEIVKAINNLDIEFRYKIIGKISEELKKELSILDLNNKVDYIDWIEKTELDIIMEQAICGVVVLDYCLVCCGKEGQLGSNKIFEYMLSGLPVVCSDFKLWREMIVDKYKCGIYVEPKNSSQIEEAIRWMLQNREEAKEMGLRGRDAVFKEFNWEAHKNQFLQKYIEI